MTIEEILKEYPDLEAEDIKACLRYAAFLSTSFTLAEIVFIEHIRIVLISHSHFINQDQLI